MDNTHLYQKKKSDKQSDKPENIIPSIENQESVHLPHHTPPQIKTAYSALQ